MDNIVIIGSSGHAKVVIDIVQQLSQYNIVGLLDRNRQINETTMGYRVIGKEEDLPKLCEVHSLKGLVIAIGDNFVRSTVAARVRELCPELVQISAIHPRACIAKDVCIGAGSVIMAGVVINPGATVGRFCILNTNSSLDHDCVLEDFASLAPRVATGGNCRIGSHSAIGIGAVMIHGVQVGEHSVIGAGSLVNKSIAAFSVAYGMPARKIRDRRAGENYLSAVSTVP
jgi:sugar O-acyltransferase (sialic acid O-acetyltransferase NeuD family)